MLSLLAFAFAVIKIKACPISGTPNICYDEDENSPCAPENTQANGYSYPSCTSHCHFIQCDAVGSAHNMPCGAGTVWDQSIHDCNHPPSVVYGSYTGEYVHVVSDSRDDCQAICENMYGTDLATILTQTDLDKADVVMNNEPIGWIGAIIGLTDQVIEGEFVWEDGTSCTETDGKCVSYWAPGQPDNIPDIGPGEGDCVYLHDSKFTYEFDCNWANIGSTPCLCNAPVSNPAKQVNEVINKGMTTHNTKNKYNYYEYIILIGLIAFILINNVFIGCWCLGKNKKYAKVKFDVFGDEEI